MRILLATTNPGKLREIQAVLADPAIELIALPDLGRTICEPVEDGDTFEANALKKARHYAAASGMCCLADDSGLEVDALGGAPGVRSARYAGLEGPRDVIDPANNKLLLQMLVNVSPAQRTARFVCAMALASPTLDLRLAAPLVVRGTFEGHIITPDQAADPSQAHLGRGVNGFGYDPLFFPAATPGRTSAELSPDEKNAISHRGDATRRMHAAIRQLPGLTSPR